MSNLISVIVPVYNIEKYIEECLLSLMNQTYSSIEILVVDDGSTDRSGELSDAFAAKYPDTITVYHTENHGLSAARNIGLKHSKGEFVCFVDSDDWIEPEMLEVLYRSIHQDDADISTCGMFWDYGLKDSNPMKTSDHRAYAQKTFFHEMICNPNVYGYVCNKLIKGDLARKYSFDESLLSQEDMDYCMNLAKDCSRVVSTESQLYHYRQRADSMTGELKYSERKLSVARVYERAMPIYAQYCSDDVYIVERNYLKILLNLLGRMKVSKVEDEQQLLWVRAGIHRYLKPVLTNRNNSLTSKINIIMTWLFPAALLRLKQQVIKATRTKKL